MVAWLERCSDVTTIHFLNRRRSQLICYASKGDPFNFISLALLKRRDRDFGTVVPNALLPRPFARFCWGTVSAWVLFILLNVLHQSLCCFNLLVRDDGVSLVGQSLVLLVLDGRLACLLSTFPPVGGNVVDTREVSHSFMSGWDQDQYQALVWHGKHPPPFVGLPSVSSKLFHGLQCGTLYWSVAAFSPCRDEKNLQICSAVSFARFQHLDSHRF